MLKVYSYVTYQVLCFLWLIIEPICVPFWVYDWWLNVIIVFWLLLYWWLYAVMMSTSLRLQIYWLYVYCFVLECSIVAHCVFHVTHQGEYRPMISGCDIDDFSKSGREFSLSVGGVDDCCMEVYPWDFFLSLFIYFISTFVLLVEWSSVMTKEGIVVYSSNVAYSSMHQARYVLGN